MEVQDTKSLNAKASCFAGISTSRDGPWTGHWTSATRRCISFHLENMVHGLKAPLCKINAKALLFRCTKPTLRPSHMRQLLRSYRQYHHPPINSPRAIATKSHEIDKPFEEEELPDYESELFYPVNIGDTINLRYHVIGKLGFGANSTVWFCRDLSYGTDILLALRYDRLTHHIETTSMLCCRWKCTHAHLRGK